MVHRPRLVPLQVPKIPVPTIGGIRVSGHYTLYPQYSRVPIETPRDEATSIARDLVKAVKGLQYQEKNHSGRHTQALETLTKIQRYSRNFF